MSASDEVRVHVTTANDVAEIVKRLGDFRSQYVHLGLAGIHALSALALAIDRFAAAIEPREEHP